jgi:transcription antitermination protein NusB
MGSGAGGHRDGNVVARPSQQREIDMGARRKARELALQMLYQHDLSGNTPETIVTTFEDLQKSKPTTREFATRIFQGTVDNLSKIDDMIVQQADNWRLSRMAVVDRNIIRMSIYEFLHEEDTPKLVIIDEAIEIAKKFGTQKSSQFINGILDGILKRYNLAS